MQLLWHRAQLIPIQLLYFVVFTIIGGLIVISLCGALLWQCCKADYKTRKKVILKLQVLTAAGQQAHDAEESQSFTERVKNSLRSRRLLVPLMAGVSLLIVSLSAGAYVYNQSFEGVIAVFSDNARPEAGVGVVVQDAFGKTVGTGITQKDGRCPMRERLWGENFKAWAFREKDEQKVEWMGSGRSGLSKKQIQGEVRWFPDYVCPLDMRGPFLFETSKAEISEIDVGAIREIGREIRANLRKEDKVLVLGHASRTPRHDPDSFPNYALSMSRCENVREILEDELTGSLSNCIILAPFDYRLPITDENGIELGYSQQQCVRILILRAMHAVEAKD